MHFTKFLAIVAVLATSAAAVPTSPNPPPKSPPPKSPPPKSPPPPPPSNQQSNSCGNNAQPYCCDTNEFGKYIKCSQIAGAGGTCSGTTVCCNANKSIQVCLGNVVVV